MKLKTRGMFVGIASFALAAVSFVLAGCSTVAPTAGTGLSKGANEKPVAHARGGAQLWAQNCGHCHNIRSPNSYSDAQWDVVVLHMRVRANLTADEHKQILAFLRSAH